MTIPWDLDISHNSHIPLGLLHSSKNTDYHSEFLSCCELWFLFTEACFRLTVIRNWDTELGYETTAMSFHGTELVHCFCLQDKDQVTMTTLVNSACSLLQRLMGVTRLSFVR